MILTYEDLKVGDFLKVTLTNHNIIYGTLIEFTINEIIIRNDLLGFTKKVYKHNIKKIEKIEV